MPWSSFCVCSTELSPAQSAEFQSDSTMLQQDSTFLQQDLMLHQNFLCTRAPIHDLSSMQGIMQVLCGGGPVFLAKCLSQTPEVMSSQKLMVECHRNLERLGLLYRLSNLWRVEEEHGCTQVKKVIQFVHICKPGNAGGSSFVIFCESNLI